jgi:hypothetical protein
MKITKNTIKKLIKEEMEAIIDEGFVDQIKSIGQGVKSFGQDALNRAQQASQNSQKQQDAESLQHINAKLDQILHILNMTK